MQRTIQTTTRTPDELRTLAREKRFEEIEKLTYPELKMLRALINRTRYPLEEQEEFIRFYFAARSVQLHYTEKEKDKPKTMTRQIRNSIPAIHKATEIMRAWNREECLSHD